MIRSEFNKLGRDDMLFLLLCAVSAAFMTLIELLCRIHRRQDLIEYYKRDFKETIVKYLEEPDGDNN